jgi:hypothetical protein
MLDIKCYIQKLDNLNHNLYTAYKQCITEKQISNPLIYVDICDIVIEPSMPIMSSYYMRNIFHNDLILVSYKDFMGVMGYIKQKCIVLHDGNMSDFDKQNCFVHVKKANDIIRKTNEKLQRFK